MDDELLGKIIRTIFSVTGFTAICWSLVNWWKLRNERRRDSAAENADDREFLRAERDHALAERDQERKENEKLRAMLAECERISLERLGAKVIAEAELIGLHKLLNQPTFLPGSEGMPKGEGQPGE